MRLDFLADPALAERVIVVDAETGEPIENLAWADDETGVYATIKQRPRTMADPKNADLRVKSPDGFALQIHTGEIEFVDRAVNPFKAELMALLDDPDVVAKLKIVITA
jgi:hypothetical protein